MLTMLVCVACWLSLHPYTPAYMFMHKSCTLVCRPYFNTMELWTSDTNLHLSPVDTAFCLPFCLFIFFLICLLACLFAFVFSCVFVYLVACHVSCHMLCLPCLSCIFALCLVHMLFAFFPSIACLLVSCLCLCMYTHGARSHKVRARSFRCKQKGRGCEHVDIDQAVMFSRFRGLASPIWLCTLLNPLPSSLLSLLDGLY